MSQSRYLTTLLWSVPVASLLAMFAASQLQRHAVAQDSDAEPEAVRASSLDPTRVEGHDKCIDCHKPEMKAWMASKHATRAFDLLRTAPPSLDYAEKLGIRPADIARKSLCVNCHATPQVDEVGKMRVVAGVSCESCHGGSGGANGWLNLHAAYGPRGTRREGESDEHYKARVAACTTAGQMRSENLYELAKRCFECHVVGDEKLAEVGHDHGEGFELTAKLLGEVRHNFFLDQYTNAKVATLWTDPLHNPAGRTTTGRLRVVAVVGQLVDLETSLRSLARATQESDLTDLMADRIEEASELLSDMADEVEDLDEVAAAVEEVFEKIDDDGFSTDDRQLYSKTADQLAVVAKGFAARDGSKLEVIDELELIPEDGNLEGVYQP